MKTSIITFGRNDGYKENERFYDRIEILKRGAVKKVIKQD